MHILVTGFTPFGGEEVNPSALLLPHLPAQLLGSRIDTLLLPTAFRTALPTLLQKVEELHPAAVLSMGQAGGRRGITLERVAINLDDARIPDNEGERPVDRPIAADGPAAYFSTLPVKAIVQRIRQEGLEASLSCSAGTYVCNHVMYGLLHYAATHAPQLRGGFLHLPCLPQQSAVSGAPSLPLEDMARGVVAALETMIQEGDTLPG